jgi:ParB-like chromosome segregation protein Spo0J
MIISLDKIIIDAGTQSREKMDEDVVARYADRMKDGDVFPPAIVFPRGDGYYWLADGFHRYFARRRIKAPNIECDVREGTLRDATLFGIGANNNHGLPQSNADKRRNAIKILTDPEWGEMSDRKIAELLGVSHVFISKLRKELAEKKGGNVTTTQEPRQPKPPKEPDPVAEFSEKEVEREMMVAAMDQLREENEELQDQLTAAMAGGDDIEKQKAQSIIADLRAQIRILEIELKAVKSSRDQFQAENAQLMKQVQIMQKKLKKLEQ